MQCRWHYRGVQRRRGGRNFDFHFDEACGCDKGVRVEYHWHPEIFSEGGCERAVVSSHGFREVCDDFAEHLGCRRTCGWENGDLGVGGGTSARPAEWRMGKGRGSMVRSGHPTCFDCHLQVVADIDSGL